MMQNLNLQKLTEDSWVVVDNWLSEEQASEMHSQFLKLEKADLFREAGLIQGQVQSSVRSDKICWLQDRHEISNWLNPLLDDLRTYLNQEFFLGINAQEFHLAKYAAGGHYSAHLDASKSHSSERVITLVYYLNKAPIGGELLLHLPSALYKITPSWNRLVLFRSDIILHEVLPSENDRRSLTGWFLRKRQSLI